MSFYIEHPKYGRILSFEGWTKNCAKTHCSYCGTELKKELYVTSYGMCPDHKDMYENAKYQLDEIMKYRLEQHKQSLKPIKTAS